MPIKKERHKAIVAFLSQFGPVVASGIGNVDQEVANLSVTTDHLPFQALENIAAFAKAMGQQYEIAAGRSKLTLRFL
ncbi:MAG: hypothetical protein AB3N16_07960 [Flavobacteriaceae bacterium]